MTNLAAGQLAGRVAIITGAGDGIGRAVAEAFVAEGARVLLAELNEELGQQAQRDLGDQTFFLHSDAASQADNERMVQEAVNRWGQLDILVNNAWGGGTLSRAEHKAPEQLAHAVALGFTGPWWAMRAAYRQMRERGYGRIINMCSLNGVNAHMGTFEYNTAKEALRAATRSAAREWAPYGITANAILPGAKTAASRAVFAANPQLEVMANAMNPMGRLGDPLQDIAPVAVFLASEGSRYLTGNSLFVDGGGHINGVAWAPQLED
ncbi:MULTISPECIES: SDR family NAD(P)-dependent oxidoreductase [Deinococcus]|uniref:SDR family oxidoreductase n=1 Tax=Deinococcus cavernae TaxID=2320857 RepID=A0A418V838_9DEIO|nr:MULTISPECIES: SDR family oxidoreductase [Deinococcus]RJF72258.1 SDR family oxidoreductase [Deinococcus cavernae]